MKRFRRYALVLVGLYALYLVALGPFYAMEAQGWLEFMPEAARKAVLIPALPLIRHPSVRRMFIEYLDWWYLDPNGVESGCD